MPCPGHEEYARIGGGRGATTLLKDDVAVEGDKVVLEFEGKGGKQIQREVEDPALARVVRKLGALRGRRLFDCRLCGSEERGDLSLARAFKAAEPTPC